MSPEERPEHAGHTPSAEDLVSTAKERDLEVSRSPKVSRRLALVWDPPTPSGRGRPAKTTRESVVDAGLRIASGEALEALTMRRVARELGVSTMSLYTHVPGREELIDLMVDRAYSEMDLPPVEIPFPESFRRWAQAHWTLYLQHPWILQLNVWRPRLTPHVFDAEESVLRCLATTGMTEVEIARTMRLALDALQGAARGAVAESAEDASSGVSLDEHWQSMSAFWVDYFDAERYPTMTRLWLADAFTSTASTLDETVEGLLAVIDAHRGKRSD